MMKVFKIKPDFAYQTFHTSDPNDSEGAEEEYLLDGKSKLSTSYDLSKLSISRLVRSRISRIFAIFAAS